MSPARAPAWPTAVNYPSVPPEQRSTASRSRTAAISPPATTFIGFGVGSNGALTITGAGSSFVGATGGFVIGDSGNGTFTVANGATAATNGVVHYPAATGASMIANISGAGSTWTTGDMLMATNAAGFGQMTISGGGHVITTWNQSGNAAFIGCATVTVTGAGSLWSIGGPFPTSTALFMSNNPGGPATLNVLNGGAVIIQATPGILTTSGDTRVAGTGAVATILVDGGNSTFTTPISALLCRPRSSHHRHCHRRRHRQQWRHAQYRLIADDWPFRHGVRNGTGNVTVTGANSVWNIGNTLKLSAPNDAQGLWLGVNGNSTLTIANGGTVNMPNSFGGYQHGIGPRK